jgi:FPC/CPF motif-containing protein YcgG
LGQQYVVVDVDGTKQAARQRALPCLESLPNPHRRFDQVAAPSYLGRKRGEVVRTRTTVLQAHTHQFLGTFGGAGNGDYRGELKRALQVLTSYATAQKLPACQILVRLDGLYGNAAGFFLSPIMSYLTTSLY